MTQERAARLRQMVQERTLAVPGVPNALAARLAQRMGYPAVYVSGAALSAGVLAMPDVGLITLTELAQQTAYISRAVSVPVLVDADTGFGGPLQVERAVVELESAGAAAIQIEDQPSQKRCGHLSGKQVIPIEQMVAKIRAAAAARHSPHTVIVARTDARGACGLEEAVRRAEHYVRAGADWIFPEALESEEEFVQFAEAIDVPLVANMTEFGKSPLLDMQRLADIGYAVILYPVTLLRIAVKAMESALRVLAAEQSQRSLLPHMQTRAELYELLDYRDYDERDRRYFGEGGNR
ncbi:MAG: methylisocitrate lyase [Pirellulaceae bacterium]|nr:MAG: methylisocitrate lyase [Pirellulaceae bacterium]